MKMKIENLDKKIILKLVYIIILILWCLLIFYLSNQKGINSQSSSDRIVKLFLKIFPSLDISNLKIVSFIIRKLAHMFLYFVLYLLSYLNFKNKKYALLFCFFYAITDEIHQLYIPGRSGELRDVLIDTTASFIGYLLVELIRKIKKKKKGKGVYQ